MWARPKPSKTNEGQREALRKGYTRGQESAQFAGEWGEGGREMHFDRKSKI